MKRVAKKNFNTPSRSLVASQADPYIDSAASWGTEQGGRERKKGGGRLAKGGNDYEMVGREAQGGDGYGRVRKEGRLRELRGGRGG